jgi:hypothetical protein
VLREAEVDLDNQQIMRNFMLFADSMITSDLFKSRQQHTKLTTYLYRVMEEHTRITERFKSTIEACVLASEQSHESISNSGESTSQNYDFGFSIKKENKKVV